MYKVLEALILGMMLVATVNCSQPKSSTTLRASEISAPIFDGDDDLGFAMSFGPEARVELTPEREAEILAAGDASADGSSDTGAMQFNASAAGQKSDSQKYNQINALIQGKYNARSWSIAGRDTLKHALYGWQMANDDAFRLSHTKTQRCSTGVLRCYEPAAVAVYLTTAPFCPARTVVQGHLGYVCNMRGDRIIFRRVLIHESGVLTLLIGGRVRIVQNARIGAANFLASTRPGACAERQPIERAVHEFVSGVDICRVFMRAIELGAGGGVGECLPEIIEVGLKRGGIGGGAVCERGFPLRDVARVVRF